MDTSHSHSESGLCTREEDLNLYLDGELPVDVQADLFSHLSGCSQCREVMDSVLMFRRMSRQEYVVLPPAADDEFFKRLARIKNAGERQNRSEEREPLWNSRRSVSIKSAVFAVFAVFILGLLLPRTEGPEMMTALVEFEEELVDLDREVKPQVLQSYIHVFVPGLTVEANKDEEETRPLESF